MNGLRPVGLPEAFRRFPGAVLLVSADGEIIDSNDVLERELGGTLRGGSFLELLDRDSSGAKWDGILRELTSGGHTSGRVWELVLRGENTLLEPRQFAMLWDPELRGVWLLEQHSDPRLDQLREQVNGIVSELANTQRELVKERSRLAGALNALEVQYRESEQLARTIQEQKHKLEVRNGELQAMAEELRRRSDELARSNEALDEFAHVVSHDLKAPLRAVAQYSGWLEEDLGDALTADNREHLDRLTNRVAHMQAMIEGVLEYARAGRVNALPEAIDVGQLLGTVVDMLEPPRDLTVEIGAAMPVVLSERAPLQQVFMNLVGNALRYARPGRPAVRIGARQEGSACEFSVQDNGPGIAPAAREKIWGLFQTGGGDADREGSGIGLAVVRKLVEARGGRVWVDSEEGEGATFRFTWPARPLQPPDGTIMDSPADDG